MKSAKLADRIRFCQRWRNSSIRIETTVSVNTLTTVNGFWEYLSQVVNVCFAVDALLCSRAKEKIDKSREKSVHDTLG